MRSLQSRLLLSTSIVLGFFLLISAIILDHNFRTNKIHDIVARLSIHIKELMGLVLDKSGKPCERKFQLSDEGYVAEIPPRIFAVVVNPEAALHTEEGRVIIWQSESTKVKLDSPVPFTSKVIDGQVSFSIETAPNGEKFVSVSYATFLEQVNDCEKYRKELDMPSREAGESDDPASRVRLAGEDEDKKPAPNNGRPLESTQQIVEVIDLNKNRKRRKQDAGSAPPAQTGWPKIKSLGDGNVRAVIKISESLDRQRKSYNILRTAFHFDPRASLNKDIRDFRVLLAIGFIVVIIAYLLLLALFLRLWGLRPMRQVSEELEKIKAGELTRLADDYPKEIQGLTEGINRLIVSERARQERFRNSLGDLAHSLKTPLAVLFSESENHTSKEAWQQSVREQVERMRQIINYQLERAVTAGKTTLAEPVDVAQTIERMITTLSKVYADKAVRFETRVEAQVVFVGDQGDLLEVLGNLMENACKWCRTRVSVGARNLTVKRGRVLELVVDDDGPGVPEDMLEQVQKRGFRADEAVSGQGIGLAVVKEIVHAYSGSMRIERSPWDGARFVIRL